MGIKTGKGAVPVYVAPEMPLLLANAAGLLVAASFDVGIAA